MVQRKRDYRAEYARRILQGAARGLTRSQSRGHPKPRETLATGPAAVPSFNRQLEAGFKAVEKGKTLTAAAKEIHVSPERLRRYLSEQRIAAKRAGKWIALPDNGVRQMRLYTQGQTRIVHVNRPQASDVGRYNGAVGLFLRRNNPEILLPYVDRGVTDIRGAYHPFETDPNTLYRLAHTGDETFEQVYQNHSLAGANNRNITTTILNDASVVSCSGSEPTSPSAAAVRKVIQPASNCITSQAKLLERTSSSFAAIVTES